MGPSSSASLASSGYLADEGSPELPYETSPLVEPPFTYEGEKNAEGLRHGEGLLTIRTPEYWIRLVGQFRNHEFKHGQSLDCFGVTQHGDFESEEVAGEDSFFSRGTRCLPDNSAFIGQFFNHKLKERGIALVPKERTISIGYFRNGELRHGIRVHWNASTRPHPDIPQGFLHRIVQVNDTDPVEQDAITHNTSIKTDRGAFEINIRDYLLKITTVSPGLNKWHITPVSEQGLTLEVDENGVVKVNHYPDFEGMFSYITDAFQKIV